VLGRRPCRARTGRNVGYHPAALAYCNFKNIAFGKVRFSSHPFDFAWNFPPRLISTKIVRLSVLRNDLAFPRFAHGPPRVHP
jgi:hypothetical protein